MTRIRDAIMRLPRRVEPISGQNFSYIKLDDVVALLETAAADEAYLCPICAEPLKADDKCATDITEGTCHFECLEGSVVVDLETGEEMPNGDMHSFRFGNAHSAPETKFMGRETVTDDELDRWAKQRADDAGHLARELIVYRRLSGARNR